MDNQTKKEYKRKNYGALDVAKFVCAILLVASHFASEWASFPVLVDYAFSIYIIAVPFFFCCSGFLFFKKWNALEGKEKKKEYFIAYQKRIWIMYGIWTLIYLPFIVISWIKNNVFTFEKILSWLHQSLVFQTYSTIWFLPALAVGIALTCLLITMVKKHWICVTVCVVLYLLGSFGYSYSFLFDDTFIGRIYGWYGVVFKTTRNGLFNAVPFLYMGYMLSQTKIEPTKNNFLINGGLAVGCFALVVMESFLLKLKFHVAGMDFIYMLVPFTYFFIKMLLSIDVKERIVYILCRKISLLMFVSQRLFLTALPLVLPKTFQFIYVNSYLGLFMVLGLTIGFSLLIVCLSKKWTFLKWIV